MRSSWLIVAALLLGCAEPEPAPGPAMRPTRPRTCLPGEGVTGNPQTIEDTVALINSFPMPVTLPCLLESLDRPIALTASSNVFSAQPAYGPNNPRIFIVRDQLVLAVVTKGDGSELLEFGYQHSPTRSVKAEIHFPVTEPVALAAPYERVEYDDGSSCAFCHFNEVRDTSIDFAKAYLSEVIPPANHDIVELDYMQWSFQECDPELEPERCEIYDSIFANGEVVETTL